MLKLEFYGAPLRRGDTDRLDSRNYKDNPWVPRGAILHRFVSHGSARLTSTVWLGMQPGRASCLFSIVWQINVLMQISIFRAGITKLNKGIIAAQT
jgi:hypothetical protein